MFFMIVFLVIMVVVLVGMWKKRLKPLQAIAILLGVVYWEIVLESTVFTRTPKAYPRYELELFWSWKELFRGNLYYLEEILLNMILFLPLGILFPISLGHRRRGLLNKKSLWMILLIGIVQSSVIELLQLFLHRGLFELDDILHNALGFLVGYEVLCLCIRWKNMFQHKKSPFRKRMGRIFKNPVEQAFALILR